MNVTYAYRGEPRSFDIEETEDLPAIYTGIEEHLRTDHPELTAVPDLPVRIADAVLDALADDGEVIHLGEMAS